MTCRMSLRYLDFSKPYLDFSKIILCLLLNITYLRNILNIKVARKKSLLKHRRHMKEQRNLFHTKIVQTPLTVAVLMVSPLQMVLTLKDAVSLIPKTAVRPTSDAALTEFPQVR